MIALWFIIGVCAYCAVGLVLLCVFRDDTLAVVLLWPLIVMLCAAFGVAVFACSVFERCYDAIDRRVHR